MAVWTNFCSNFRQQDALEFFTILFDALHEDIKERPSSAMSSCNETYSATLPNLPASRKRRHRLRIGGVKASETALEELAGDEADACSSSPAQASSTGKVNSSRRRAFKGMLSWVGRPNKRAVSSSRLDQRCTTDENEQDTCQPAV